MAYLSPYDDPTKRQRRALPPPPPVQSDQQDPVYDNGQWSGVQAARPRTAPPAPPNAGGSDAFNLEFSGQQPPAQGAGGMQQQPAVSPTPPIVMPEPPAPGEMGLNTVGQKLLEYGQHKRFGVPHAGPDGKTIGTYGGGIQDELAALTAADPTSPVNKTAGGYEVGPAEKPSRLKQALMGVLQGALAGGSVGGLGGAIGGAATGGVAGAVSPKLIKALTRQQEIDYSQGKVDRELGNKAKQGSIAVQQSQVTENTAQAERARQGTPHYERDADGNVVAVYGTQGKQVTVDGEPLVGKDPDAETEHQKAVRADTEKYRTATLERRKVDAEKREKRETERANRFQLRIDPTSGDQILFNPKTGRTSTAKRGTKGAVKVAQAEAIWKKAGEQYDTDAKPKFEEADQLREEADTLGKDESGNDSAGQAYRNKGKITELRKRADRLEREAEGIATKVRTMQVEGDKLAVEAEATNSTGKASKSGQGKLSEQQIRDAAAAAGLDPDTAVQRARIKKRL